MSFKLVPLLLMIGVCCNIPTKAAQNGDLAVTTLKLLDPWSVKGLTRVKRSPQTALKDCRFSLSDIEDPIEGQNRNSTSPCQQVIQELKRTITKLAALNIKQDMAASSNDDDTKHYDETKRIFRGQMYQIRIQADHEAQTKIDEIYKDLFLNTPSRRFQESDRIDRAIAKVVSSIKYVETLSVACIQKANIILQMTNQLHEDSDIYNPALPLLDSYITGTQLKPIDNPCRPVIEEIQQSIAPYVNAIQNDLVRSIQNGHYLEIINVSWQCNVVIEGYFENLVQKAYTENTEAAMVQFATDLPRIQATLTVLTELYSQMEQNKHITPSIVLRMVIRLQEIMGMPKYPATEKTTHLYNKLLESVKNDMHFWAQDLTNGNYSQLLDVVEHSYNLMRIDFLEPLVLEVYSSGETAVSAIIKFACELPADGELLLHLTLFKEMEKANNFTPATVLKMAVRINKIMMPEYSILDTPTSKKASDLLNKLHTRVEKYMPVWAQEVISGNYSQLSEIRQQYYDLVRMDFFELLVQEAYTTNKGAEEAIIKFSRELPVGSELLVLLKLYNQMSKTNLMPPPTTLRMTFRVKEVMEMPNYPSFDNTTRAKASSVYKKLQQLVKRDMRDWAKDVRSDNYSQLLEILKESTKLATTGFLKALVQRAYIADEITEASIIKFASKLPLDSELLVLHTLFEQMKEANHIKHATALSMDFRVKYLMDDVPSYASLDSATKEKTSNLYKMLQKYVSLVVLASDFLS